MGEHATSLELANILLQGFNTGLLVLIHYKSSPYTYIIVVNENSLLGLNMSKPNAFLLTVGRKAATSSPCMALLKYSFSPLRNQHFPKTCVPGRRSHDENGATGEDSGNANHGNQKRLGVHDNSKNVKVETRPFPRFESKQT